MLSSFRLNHPLWLTYLRRPQTQIFLLAAFFLIWRLTLLILFHPRHFFLWPEEELYRGLIGYKIALAPTIPILNLLPDNYAGGSLIVGHLIAFFFKILGPTAFALKLVPLLFSFGAFLIIHILIRNDWGPRPALYASLFYIFAPPSYIQLSLTAMGDHYETLFFTAASLWLLFKIVLEQKNGIYSAALGLLAGFSLWFAYIYGVTLLAALMWWLIMDPQFYRRRSFGRIFIYFWIGFSPWFLINLKNHFGGLILLEKPLWEHFSWHYFADILRFEKDFPPVSELLLGLMMPDWQTNIFASLLRRCYLLLLFGPFVVEILKHRFHPSLIFDKKKPLLLWCWIYLFCFAALIQASDFRADYYCYPALSVTFMLAAFYWNRLEVSQRFLKYLQPVKFAGVNVLIGIAIFASARWFSLPHAGNIFTMTGFSYYGAGWAAEFSSFSFCKDLRSCCYYFPLLDDVMTRKQRHTLSYAAALRSVQELSENGNFKVMPPPKSCPLPIRRYFYYLSGGEILQKSGNLSTALLELESLRAQDTSLYHLAVKGLLTAWGRLPEEMDLRSNALLEKLDPEDQPFYWRSIAEKKTEYWLRDQKFSRPPLKVFVTNLLQSFPAEAPRSFILRGVGRALLRVAWSVRRPSRLVKMAENLPPDIKKPVLEGVGGLMLSKEMLSFSQVVRASLAARLNENSMENVMKGRENFMGLFQ